MSETVKRPLDLSEYTDEEILQALKKTRLKIKTCPFCSEWLNEDDIIWEFYARGERYECCKYCSTECRCGERVVENWNDYRHEECPWYYCEECDGHFDTELYVCEECNRRVCDDCHTCGEEKKVDEVAK